MQVPVYPGDLDIWARGKVADEVQGRRFPLLGEPGQWVGCGGRACRQGEQDDDTPPGGGAHGSPRRTGRMTGRAVTLSKSFFRLFHQAAAKVSAPMLGCDSDSCNVACVIGFNQSNYKSSQRAVVSDDSVRN